MHLRPNRLSSVLFYPRWIICFGLCATVVIHEPSAFAEQDITRVAQLLRSYCVDCHGSEQPEAGLNLEALASVPAIAERFRQWRKVAEMVQHEKMPPPDATQPDEVARRQLVDLVRSELRRVAMAHADDPGPVTMRRLSSAEFAYSIQDLTGIDLQLQRELIGDAVGGEGFTNVGGAQFVQDSTLERYLAAAKKVAAHAVVGAGPLRFYQDPGQTGFELSAISRIQDIYRANGFRTAAGEGGEPFGLDRYARALFVAWRYRYRQALGLADESLTTLAGVANVNPRFAEYILSVLTEGTRSFPTTDIIALWHALPAPVGGNRRIETDVRRQCDLIQQALHDWQSKLGENPDAKEEARVLAEHSFDVSRTQLFEMNINWPEGTKTAHLTFYVESADGGGRLESAVIWRSPVIQFRIPDRVLEDPQPMQNLLQADDVKRLRFAEHQRGTKIAPNDFVTVGAVSPTVQLPIREGATSAQLTVEAELDIVHGDDRIVRCTIAQHEETDQGKAVSALLANSSSPSFQAWKRGVLEFAKLLPQISHREPAPSDRDPIPPPFDSTYNNAERNHFHARIKYHRDDRFLVENILDDATRKQLDEAWSDLLGSFEFHNAVLRVVDDKFQIGLNGRGISELDAAWIAELPLEPRGYVRGLYDQYHAIQKAFVEAQPGHLRNVLQFAAHAWRRPLSSQEQGRLRQFYDDLRNGAKTTLPITQRPAGQGLGVGQYIGDAVVSRVPRQESKLGHRQAIRALLTRVLVAPDFIYRAEGFEPTDLASASRATQKPEDAGPSPLTDWELASRLSFFLWSSLPDEELRRAAMAGELQDPKQVALQARRMLRDPKARRLSTEFFGQWFGFYQFDRYRGIDPQRFPEFTDLLKAAMHNEAVSFFENIVRKDRPVGEILFADYGFLNRELAQHYGISVDWPSKTEFESAEENTRSSPDVPTQFERIDRYRRGGLLGLGAVLAVTSAPRRTSPVKRGDWILRRVLGKPVPPPPADAGSIPGDDVLADGKTVRQRLEAHRRNVSCQNCHARIDPLGFTLEHFDAVGRWRDRYGDGAPIDDQGTLQDGTVISGPNGLRDYLENHENQFQRTLCTKLVGYALGRAESIADVALIDSMLAALEDNGQFSNLVEKIVVSKQFRYKARK